FLVAWARPRLRRRVVASSMLPLASVSAALHSIIPAPVRSRSFLTVAAVISAMSLLLLLLFTSGRAAGAARSVSKAGVRNNAGPGIRPASVSPGSRRSDRRGGGLFGARRTHRAAAAGGGVRGGARA